MNPWNAFFLGTCLCSLSSASISLARGMHPESFWQRKAVEAGHAYYDALTGEFTWNEPCGPRPESKR